MGFKPFFIFLLGTLGTAAVVAQNNVLPGSTVRFTVSNLGINTVKGSFEGVEGEVKIDPSHPEAAAFAVKLDAATVQSGVDKRDEHLRGEDFFDVENHPFIEVVSTSVRWSEGDARYFFEGNLTIRDEVHTIQCPFAMEMVENQRVLTASFDVEREAFGLGSSYGSFVIGKTVTVHVRLVVED